jgi:hypothetical protein
MRVKIGRDWEPDRAALLEGVREFAALLAGAPFRNKYGLRGVSAFAFWWFLRRHPPDVVFEVGVWRGFSTWLIEQAVPQAEIHCFDPIFFLQPWMSRWKVGRTYRSPRARYWTDEFSCAPVGEIAAAHASPLAFFDDHQDKLARLRQARAAGIRDIVFDDNMPNAGTHRTLEDMRGEPEGRRLLEQEIEAYEIFPALWPVDFHLPGLDIVEQGLGFPVEPALRPVYDDRQWHSSVTYVRLRP